MKLTRQLLAMVIALAAIAGAALGADVLTNWKEHCAKCHGDDGKGDTKMGRKLSIADLTDASVQSKFTDEAAVKAMKEGVTDKAGKVAMKPIEGLSADEMQHLVKFVRGLKK
jgi:cytochrome c553